MLKVFSNQNDFMVCGRGRASCKRANSTTSYRIFPCLLKPGAAGGWSCGMMSSWQPPSPGRAGKGQAMSSLPLLLCRSPRVPASKTQVLLHLRMLGLSHLKKKKRRNQSVRKRIYGAGQDAVDDETSLIPTGNVMLREEPAASGEIKYPGGVMVRGWGEWVGWAAGKAAPPHPAPTPAVLTRPFAPAAPASPF